MNVVYFDGFRLIVVGKYRIMRGHGEDNPPTINVVDDSLN